LPFRRPVDADQAFAAMRGNAIGSLKYKLGLLTSRFRANHPLKVCPHCMIEDKASVHVAYWHRAHQLPGVMICPKHHVPLMVSMMKANGVERFLWRLPVLDEMYPPSQNTLMAQSISASSPLARLANASMSLTDLPSGFHFDLSKLVYLYKDRLTSMGLQSATGRLRTVEIGQAYMEHCQSFALDSEFASLPCTPSDAWSQVSPLLYGRRTGTHPLRHLLLITWFFGNWGDFWDAYQRTDVVGTDDPVNINPESKSALLDLRRNDLVTMMLSGKASARAAATRFGVDVTTAMAWAAAAGINISTRAKVLKPPVRMQLLRTLRNGADKADAAKAAGVSVSAVTRILRTEVGLHQAWTDARFAHTQKVARGDWARVTKANPLSGVKALRLLVPASYAWLYRNDRDWLDDQRARLASARIGNHVKVNWDARDVELADAIRHAYLIWSTVNTGKAIRIGHLCQLIPDLKAKLGHLDRLPLTHGVIQRIVNRPTHLDSR